MARILSSNAPPAVRHVHYFRPLGATTMLLLLVGVAHADDFVVYSPHVLATQTEIELRGYSTDDARTDLNGARAAELSLAHGFTDWWKAELYVAEYKKDPGQVGGLSGYEFENIFQLTEPGEYWLDYGLLASYEHKTIANEPDAIEFGPLFSKAVGRLSNTVNLIWEKQVGSGASGKLEFRYSYSGTYAVSSLFQPGLEAYGRPADHAWQVGPVAKGEWHVPGTQSNLEYRVGVVFGINDSAPRRTWLVQFEYEYF